MSAQPVLLRAGTPGDIPFILKSWLSSFRHSYHVRGIEGPVYFAEHRRIVEALIPRCGVLVACDRQDPTMIYAFLVSEVIDKALVVHWVYVRSTFQDFGIGTKLIAEVLKHEPDLVAIIYTHQTKAGRKWAGKMQDRTPFLPTSDGSEIRMPVIYNPYLMYRTLGT